MNNSGPIAMHEPDKSNDHNHLWGKKVRPSKVESYLEVTV